MIIKHKDQRVGIFIDAQNLYHSAKHLHHKKVNFAEVLRVALGDRTLVRALAYVIASDTDEERGFFDALNKVGIETKIKDLQVFSGGAKKADWDVGLAVDAIRMAGKLDTVVIVSGDGDFLPLVDFLKNTGCQVEIMAFGRSTSGRIKEVADLFIDMDTDSSFLIGARSNQQLQNTNNGNSEAKPRGKRPHRRNTPPAPEAPKLA